MPLGKFKCLLLWQYMVVKTQLYQHFRQQQEPFRGRVNYSVQYQPLHYCGRTTVDAHSS